MLTSMPLDLPQFVPLETVMHDLSISRSQAYALVRSGELRAIQVGGRNQWRVDLAELEAYIERAYAETESQLGGPLRKPHAGSEHGRDEHGDA